MLVDVRALKVMEQNLLFILSDLLLPPLFILPPRVLDHLQNFPSAAQLRRHWHDVTSFAISTYCSSELTTAFGLVDLAMDSGSAWTINIPRMAAKSRQQKK